jgi:hypothetical protein
MEIRGLAQGGACPFPSSQGRVDTKDFASYYTLVQPVCVPLFRDGVHSRLEVLLDLS